MSNNDQQPLTAAPFTPQSATGTPAAPPKQVPSVVLVGLAVGVMALAIVVFILPSWVDSKTPSAADRTADTAEVTSRTPLTTPVSPEAQQNAGRSPFAEAQESQARRQAQAALEQVLELQALLQDRAVTTWGETDYQAALGRAALGDNSYRDRDFSGAIRAYEHAAAALADLEASIPARIDTALNTLNAAIESGDSDLAQATLTQLTQLAPEHPERAPLSARVAAIPTVSKALADAQSAAIENDFATAVAAAETAIAADAAHQGARQRLSEYQQAARDAGFRKAMSTGYLALEAAQFEQAEAAFRGALTIRAGAPEPNAALLELASARTAATLKSLQRKGRAQEHAEQWQQALSTYQQAAKLDANVLFAREGIAQTQPRADLATALDTIVAEQARLIDPRVIREAEATLQTARQIAAPGPVLSAQIDNVQRTLDYAKTPVQVALTSDGLTDVTLLRVKRLGPFENSALTLRPGRYTAVGVRTGFRDVRIEFDVAPNSEAAPVHISCNEAI